MTHIFAENSQKEQINLTLQSPWGPSDGLPPPEAVAHHSSQSSSPTGPGGINGGEGLATHPSGDSEGGRLPA